MLFSYLGRAFQGVKLGIAATGALASGGAIIYGIVASGGVVFIVGGAVCLLTSGFSLYDGSLIFKQIKEQVDFFKTENKRLQEQVTKFDEQLGTMKTENRTLKDGVEKLRNLGERFKEEHKRLTELVAKSEQKVLELQETKDAYETENNKLKEQVGKLHKLHEESKRLIKNLVTAGNAFNEFGEALGDDVQSLDETAATMKNLLEQFEEGKFDELDLDGDGKITLEEFSRAVSSKEEVTHKSRHKHNLRLFQVFCLPGKLCSISR